MTFQPNQIRKLRTRINLNHVKSRQADGLVLHYIEGWHAISEANRIFGFDNWDRESVFSQCVFTKMIGTRYAAAYVTRIKITVRAGEIRIVREGCGAGEALAVTPGQAHEFAAKAAETDATKRALSTFGNPFGLSLYGGVPEPKANGTNGKSRRPHTKFGTEPSSRRETVGTPHPNRFEATTQDQRGDPNGHASGLRANNDNEAPRLDAIREPVPAQFAQNARVPIDKSELALPEVKRRRDKNHLRFVAAQACIVCGRSPAHAHHLTFAQPKALGKKVSDEFAVPLCVTHHRELHNTGNERSWWGSKSIDPQLTARELWSISQGLPEAALAQQ